MPKGISAWDSWSNPWEEKAVRQKLSEMFWKDRNAIKRRLHSLSEEHLRDLPEHFSDFLQLAVKSSG